MSYAVPPPRYRGAFAPRTIDTPPFSLEVPEVKAVEGETIPRRLASHVHELQSEPEPGIATVWDVVARSASVFGDGNAVGSRTLLHTHEEMKKGKKTVDGEEIEVDKKWVYYEMSPYHWKSFKSWKQQAEAIGSGYRELGLMKEDRVYIFAATSERWLASAHGAASQSMPIVTAYDTLGEAAIRHALLATKPKLVFLDPHLIPTLKNTLKDAGVQVVIYNDEHDVNQDHLQELKTAHEHLKVLSFSALVTLGSMNLVAPVPPKTDDLCCIMYTSGSTGNPKGVLLTHKNIVGAMAGIQAIVGPFLGPGDILIAYLPLAHIFEFMFENASFFWGSALGYGSAKTLTDASTRNCKGDIRELRPTVMVGVPAIWEGIRKGVVAKVSEANVVVKGLFWAALKAKGWFSDRGLSSLVFWDAIFGKVKEATGGRLRLIANGAGPISHSTQRFLSLAVAPMLSGYGLTEGSGMGALTSPFRWNDRAAGDIPASIEIKLVDFAEAGYYSSSNPPQGEVWIRGYSVTSGYFQDKEETERAFNDGWFRTGDIGEFDSNGHLIIIDRMKNLVKTQNGEYIALEKLESIYRTSPVVFSICVFASLDKSRPVALIVPAEPALEALAKANDIPIPTNLMELRNDPKVEELVLKDVLAAGKRGGLAGIEMLAGVVIVQEEWTPQTGFVTSAMKLQRRSIANHYKKDIERAYSKLG
ncbi:Acyl-CoA synthetase FUM16 [Lachnellula arida]|uniref:Acyl-CoA synthetase FUM16 n=1 Tax=Lachnellula arida TaxID=1316785 RepID=A0A8T9AZU3_9HELO|nr:Acyl-CoA synthetase FUM16 [Lachnellula arida]